MAITTYDELVTAIANWGHRTDLTDRIPEFIVLAEAYINKHLRVQDMVCRSTSDVTTEFFSLPDDYREIIAVQINESASTKPLNYVTPQQLSTEYYGSGEPQAYTIIGDEIRLGRSPDGTYEVELNYYANVPALTSSAPTNWLLTKDPGMYLDGALFYLARLIRDKDEEIRNLKTFTDAINGAMKQDRDFKYSGSALVSKPDMVA